ncbi:MAG TPA: hypothetical protein VLH94_04070 [Spirochaetia bacterium]|nr:hypothetical protein [Spirochaetia bacterium]
MADLQKSPSWDKANMLEGFFVRTGYPFKEKFPQDYSGKTFTLITRDGKRHEGVRVDDSRQYAAEGKQWRNCFGDTIDDYVVVCWIEEATPIITNEGSDK